MTGTIITKKGVALIAKLLATKQQLVFTRAAVGTGSCPSGYDPASMLDLNQYHMDGMIAGCEADGEEATVTFQISSEDVEEGFIITEAGIYANDADEGEILYAYLDLTGDPQYVYPKGSVVQKFAEIDFKTIVGSVKNVTAVISPSSLVTRATYDAGMATKIDADGGDIADAKVTAYTAAAEEYPVPAVGETIKVILGKVIKFIQDAKAGFCKKSELVDNCTSSDTDKPTTAKQAKVLWDKITEVVTALATHKSSGDHDGRYYTESEMDNKLAGKSGTGHNHDDRYYTETEMNTKLAGKSDSGHGHSGMLTTGSLVDNCTSTATDKAPTAKQAKVLMDKLNQLNSDLTPIGAQYWSGAENISLSSNVWKSGSKSITLPAGMYMIVAHGEMPVGNYTAYLATDGIDLFEQCVSFPVTSYDYRRATATYFCQFTQSKTIKAKFVAAQNVTAVNCEICAVRIK